MVQLRLFGPAREAAGTSVCELPGERVGDVLRAASDRFGSGFEGVLEHSRVWVNGEPAGADHRLEATDELAVLPPVSGG
jgi:molybdopterin converting factor small subunit